MDRLAGRDLERGPERRLRDVYLDRGDGELEAAGLALRLRFEEDSEPVLAVKDAGRDLGGGGVERREAEAPWGPEAVALLDRELGRAGLSHATPPPDPLLRPLASLRAAGFRIVQDRVTRRLPAALRGEGVSVGELALDEVRFRAGGREITHREIEVEADGDADDPESLVREASRALLERFGGELRRWDHPKLATGRALVAIPTEELAALVGEDDRLLPEAYDRLERMLRGGA